MTHEELLAIVQEAWLNLDATELLKHIHEDFVYDSQWVFASMPAKDYPKYITGKFETIKRTGAFVEVEKVKDPYYSGYMLRFKQRQDVAFLRIREKDGQIVKMDMCMF